MSATKSLHYELCLEGAKWLRRRQNYERCKAKMPCFKPELCSGCRQGFKYVAVELCTYGTENCDVWDDDGLPVYAYRMRQRLRGWHYIMRMTRRHYFGLLDRRAKPSMMQNLYIHKACSPYLFDDILEFWGHHGKE